MRDPGFTITFDSKGGTDVPAHDQMYGQLLELPEPPTREGYVDTARYELWVVEQAATQADMTLCAGWEKIQ